MSIDLPSPTRRPYPLARPMFWLGFASLLLTAGCVHRAVHELVTEFEVNVMIYGLFILWPIIVLETWIAVVIRDRTIRPLRPTLVRATFITFMPPMRMGMPCPFTGRLWVPTWGWCDRGRALEDRLDKAFHRPMLVFALLILPVLLFELVRAEEVKTNRGLALALDISVAVIWMAFAIEFIIKASAVRHPFRYSRDRWLDMAIVVLPMLEYFLTSFADLAPLARLLRLSRAAAPEQLARMGQMYRLRGLLIKGWKAVLVLRLVSRLTGNTAERQLQKLESEIAEAEEALAIMKTQAAELRKKMATTGQQEESPTSTASIQAAPATECRGA
jgi:hypothetical protein